MNRSDFRRSGLQGRRTSSEVLEPIGWLDRVKMRAPPWVQRRFPPHMRFMGWRGQRIGSFRGRTPTLSYRNESRRRAQARLGRYLAGKPVRLPGRTRFKRAQQAAA